MTEDERKFQIKFQKHLLETTKLKKLQNELAIARTEKEIELKLPNKQLQEDIDKLKDLVERKKAELTDNTEVDAKESDMIAMKLIIADYEERLKLDIPMRNKRAELKDKVLSQDKDAQSNFDNVIKEIEHRIDMLVRNDFPDIKTPSSHD